MLGCGDRERSSGTSRSCACVRALIVLGLRLSTHLLMLSLKSRTLYFFAFSLSLSDDGLVGASCGTLSGIFGLTGASTCMNARAARGASVVAVPLVRNVVDDGRMKDAAAITKQRATIFSEEGEVSWTCWLISVGRDRAVLITVHSSQVHGALSARHTTAVLITIVCLARLSPLLFCVCFTF